jgi:hypothetical protein
MNPRRSSSHPTIQGQLQRVQPGTDHPRHNLHHTHQLLASRLLALLLLLLLLLTVLLPWTLGHPSGAVICILFPLWRHVGVLVWGPL